MISALVSLTLSPALSALLLKPHTVADKPTGLSRVFSKLFDRFNAGFESTAQGYASLVRKLTRLSLLVLLVYAGLA